LLRREWVLNLRKDVEQMKYLIGMIVGAGLAMCFPYEAAQAFDFVRDGIYSLSSTIANNTRGI
jgi:Sec-independent protein secretion pathway component TatC